MIHQIVVFENVISGPLKARCSECGWAFEDLSGKRDFGVMWKCFINHVDALRAACIMKTGVAFGERVRPKRGYVWQGHWDHRPHHELLTMYVERGVDCLHYAVQFAGRGCDPEIHWLYRLAVKREHVRETIRILKQDHQPWLERTFPTGPKFADLIAGTAAFAAARGRE